MKQHKDLLRKILGDIPRYTRCREGHNPFTQTGQDLVAVHRPILRRNRESGVDRRAFQDHTLPQPLDRELPHRLLLLLAMSRAAVFRVGDCPQKIDLLTAPGTSHIASSVLSRIKSLPSPGNRSKDTEF